MLYSLIDIRSPKPITKNILQNNKYAASSMLYFSSSLYNTNPINNTKVYNTIYFKDNVIEKERLLKVSSKANTKL